MATQKPYRIPNKSEGERQLTKRKEISGKRNPKSMMYDSKTSAGINPLGLQDNNIFVPILCSLPIPCPRKPTTLRRQVNTKFR